MRDIDRITDVLRLRAAGMSLPAAISQATTLAGQVEPSAFAGLRRRHPGLIPQVLRQTTLLALTRAIEDECCARAEHAVLFASFQQERFYCHSEERWNELARTARAVIVFADFSEPAASLLRDMSGPVKIPVPAADPLRREWVLVCEAWD